MARTRKLQYFNFFDASAAEAETRGCFVTREYLLILRNTLEEMVHPQTITQVCMENTTAAGIENDTIKQPQSSAKNIHYFWISDQKNLKNFLNAWKSGQKILQTILQNIIL